MRRSLCSLSIIFLSGFLLFMGAKQFAADFYWRMAHQEWREQDKIIEYLNKCIAIDDKNAVFHFSLGRTYLRRGLAKTVKAQERNDWIRKAIDEFHKAIKLEPSHSDYHFHLGISYGSLAYPPPFYWGVIQNSFKRTAMLNPTDVRHLHLMGKYYLDEYRRLKNIRMNMDEIASAIYENHEVLLRNQYQFYFQLKRIRILLEEGRFDEAIDEYHTITKKHPKGSKSLYNMIRYYQKKKNYPKAISILNEAISSILS